MRISGRATTCWPAPEFPGNTDTTIGKLGLINEQEDQFVAFLKTLTDVYSLSRRFRKDEMNRITLKTGVLSGKLFFGPRTLGQVCASTLGAGRCRDLDAKPANGQPDQRAFDEKNSGTL